MVHPKVCRFTQPGCPPRPGLLINSGVLDLGDQIGSLSEILNHEDPSSFAAELGRSTTTSLAFNQITLLAPVEQQEIWAAGVTYFRSKSARMEESKFSASAYDRVYDAPRPELFFKSMPHKVVPPGEAVGIRCDSQWNVPEPELVLVFNPHRRLVGYTIGNDMSSRDIEGENLLYLPQAKTYLRSCAIGPGIVLGPSEEEARSWRIQLTVRRGESDVFHSHTQADQIKRSFSELADYLHRAQEFPHGAMLLTGTGIVPADNFTLHQGDLVQIEISGIGSLLNSVITV